MSSCRLSSAIALAALLAYATGFAQSEIAPKVVPPALTTPAAVKYPETAIAERYFADVEVVLVIDVDKSGAVTKATPVSQAGDGFDDVAIASAMTLRFAPATCDGLPIAARIKYRFVFHPPPAQLVGRVSTSGGRGIAGSIRLTFPDGTTQEVSTDADGRWTVPGLNPGKVTVVVHAEGFDDDTTEVSLENGAETNLATRLSPAAIAAPQAAAADGSHVEEVVEEVNVQGVKPPREVTKRTLSREEIDKIPGHQAPLAHKRQLAGSLSAARSIS